MRRLPRRLALWGGAAAIAGGGFAFMAHNTVNASSAGVGANAVTGYTATNVSYTYQTPLPGHPTNKSPYCYSYDTGYGCFVQYVTFTLMAQSSAASARVEPTGLNVQVMGNGTVPVGQTSSLANGKCKITSWTASAGKGHVICGLSGPSKGTPYYINETTINGLSVEANQ